MDFISTETTLTPLESDSIQSPVTLGLAGLLTLFVSYLAYLSYRPRIEKKSPAFTSDTLPLVGSWRFFTQKWIFWKNSMKESKTGNFSFWLGKHHVVGVSGEAARKEFLDNKNLDFVGGAVLVGHGPDFVPPIHEIFHPTFHNGRSYFQRRLLDLLKTEQLIKRLPRVTRDARAAFEALGKNPSGITDSAHTCYHLVVKQTCRIVCADEISDNPKLMESYLGFLSILQSTSSVHTVALPWLPSWAYMKRRYARWGLSSIVTPIVNKRLQKATPRKDDAVQMFIENGDSVEYMISFFISILFISIANAGVLVGAVLNIVAHHPEWQDLIYGEIKKAAEAHSPSKDAPLVEQLDSLPLEVWESSFPTIDLCYKEAIRMWVAFPAIRLNTSPNPIQIPGTDEVIPAGSFVAYNTSDAHFNEDIYVDPTKYDPERFREGREEFKKQTYGFTGWGHGAHPCLGMRWAKLQQNIILAYALAMFKWVGCDANGQPNLHFNRKTETDLNHEHAPSLPQGLYCKRIPREKI